MYLIGLAPKYYDAEDIGFMFRPLPETRITENSRRITRTKTLDGGVVINDSGFSHGDRSFTVVVASTEALFDSLWQLFQDHAELICTTSEGAFAAHLQDIKNDSGKITMTILIEEKLSI